MRHSHRCHQNPFCHHGRDNSSSKLDSQGRTDRRVLTQEVQELDHSHKPKQMPLSRT